MPQFLRPISNITQTNFTGGFAEIDEIAFNDADYAWGANNIIAILEVGLTAGELPGPGATTIRYRIARTNVGVLSADGNPVNVTASLYQGAVLIASDVARTTTGTWTEYSWAPNVSGVTDWAALRLRFETTASGGGTSVRRGGAVSWAELEAPDPIRALSSNSQVTGNVTAEILKDVFLAGDVLVESTFTGQPEGDKLAEASISVSATVAPAEISVTKVLAENLLVTSDVSLNVIQDIALSANLQATNTIAALGIADNPVSAVVDITVVTSADLLNVFNAQANVSSDVVVLSTIDLVKNLEIVAQVTGGVAPNLTLDQPLTAPVLQVTSVVTAELLKQVDLSASVRVGDRHNLVRDSIFVGTPGAGNLPVGWNVTGTSGTLPLTLSNSEVVDGVVTQSLSIRQPAVPGYKGAQRVLDTATYVVGGIYTASVYLRVPTGVTATEAAMYPSGSPSVVTFATAAALAAQPKDVWVRYSATYTVTSVGAQQFSVISTTGAEGAGFDFALPQLEVGPDVTGFTTTHAHISIVKELSLLLNAVATVDSANLLLNQPLSSSLSVTVINITDLLLTKDFVSSIDVSAITDAYLIQIIDSSAQINTETTTYAKLTNASEGYINGTVLDNGGNPAQRTIFLYRRSDGAKIAETTSNLTTGVYQFVTAPQQVEYFVVLKESDDNGFGEDRIKGRILPFLI